MSTETTFAVRITMGNDAMQTPGDVAYVLELLATKMRQQPGDTWYDDRGGLRDPNGNTVGEWSIDAVTSAS